MLMFVVDVVDVVVDDVVVVVVVHRHIHGK